MSKAIEIMCKATMKEIEDEAKEMTLAELRGARVELSIVAEMITDEIGLKVGRGERG